MKPNPGKQPERILTQVTAREGWEPERDADIEKLSRLILSKYPKADTIQLKRRLRPLFAKAVALVEVRKPRKPDKNSVQEQEEELERKKPETLIRDELCRIRSLPKDAALNDLGQLTGVVAEYLDLRLEAEEPDFCPPPAGSTPVELQDLAERRYRLIVDRGDELIPSVSRGTEGPWSYIAELVAELLTDVTGQEPKRSWNAYENKDSGWPLKFFTIFAEMVVRPQQPPELAKLWRKAVEGRSRRRKSEARQCGPPREE